MGIYFCHQILQLSNDYERLQIFQENIDNGPKILLNTIFFLLFF